MIENVSPMMGVLLASTGHGLDQEVGVDDVPGRSPTTFKRAVVPEGFVPPDLSEGESSGPSASVILVAAPAGVGKSWLAQALAALSGNPLWDLSHFQVGSNFFTGLLVKSYGQNFMAVRDRLLTGQGALVIDALDEALVRAGLRNTVEALVDLADLLPKQAQSKASALIFGRPESIELAATCLTEQGTSWQRYDVQFFGSDLGVEYLRRKALLFAAESDRIVDSEILDRFLRFVTQELVEALGEDDRSFLGYAPVLDAIALLADRSNLFAALKEIELHPRGFAWPFVVGTLRGILERERDKFAVSFARGEAGSARSSAAHLAFNAEAQLTALLAYDLEEADVLSHEWDTEPWRDELRRSFVSQIREHPFLSSSGRGVGGAGDPLVRLRNPVFRDFLIAWAFSGGRSESRQLAYSYSRPDTSPSPALVQFVPLLAEPGAVMDSDVLGPIVDSVGASSGFSYGSPEVSLEAGEDGELLDLSITGVDHGDWTGHVMPLGRRELWLGRSAVNVAIDVPDAVLTLGTGRGDLALQGNVSIVVDEIRSLGGAVRLRSGTKALITASEISGTTEEISCGASSSLRVMVDRVGFPWISYRVDREASSRFSNQSLIRAALLLRRLSVRFMGPTLSVVGFAYPCQALELHVNKGFLSRSLFDYCVSTGVIIKSRRVYQFIPPAPSRAIRECDVTDEKLQGFLESYLDSLAS